MKLNMKVLTSSAVVAVALASGAAALFGQWADYPTPGPRTKEGKIDVAAPPPRTADGKIDFTGLWEPARGGGPGRGAGKGKGPGKGAPPAAPAKAPAAGPASDEPPVGQFFNIGAGLKGGLPPMTPWAAQVRAQRKADDNKDNPDAHCLPLGLTQLHMHPQPRKILQTSQAIVILYEANGNTRQILMDGRSLPKNDPSPWWYGYSVGHWDGDTLVVETTGFRDDVWLDVEGSPLTSTGKITERW
ncbi:MAG: hypothetical protein ACRD4E_05520, partial [Bryobacteraceae bacterium]